MAIKPNNQWKKMWEEREFMTISKPQYILDSHKKSREYCLDPDTIPIFEENLSHKELLRKFSEYEDVLKVVRFFVKKLLDSLKGNPILIVVSDETGIVLDMDGDETIKQTVNQLGICVGVRLRRRAAARTSLIWRFLNVYPLN